ncbi:unnamed protein product, partial [Meganyctiphanes norvegica]
GRENEAYQFFIRAEDQGSPKQTSDVPVAIFLLPEDETPPQCSLKYAQFFVREDAPVSSVITTLWTQGPQKVTYSIYNTQNRGESNFLNEDIDLFSITTEGLLVVQNELDHEKRSIHEITVINQTITIPPTLDYMTISVVVMDINDNSPQFSSDQYETYIAENSKIGTIVTFVTAFDKDSGSNGEVHYRIEESKDISIVSTFQINPQSGAVILTSHLDREIKSQYNFNIIATDQGSPKRTDITSLVINVKDFNDNPPIFMKESYSATVLENVKIGHILVELTVTDADEILQPLDYFITSGDPIANFKVSTLGQVYVVGSLDREKQDEYLITVTATDGKFTANTSVTVVVLDINDNGPLCREHHYHQLVSEGDPVGTLVLSIASWDADIGPNARTRHYIGGENSYQFSIDPLGGHVMIAAPLDREKYSNYELIATLEDWEHPEWQCQVKMFILVEDINDNAPEFSHHNYETSVPEDAPINSVIFKITANDPDIGVNHRVHYSLADSADGQFKIDDLEGIVALTKPLDREIQDMYRITIMATDEGSPPIASLAAIIIFVTDVNDNAPEFVQMTQHASIQENTKLGVEILRVMATSKDIGINSQITYSLEHPTSLSYIDIHPKTGIIYVATNLDHEEIKQIIATVVATDGGSPPLSSTAIVNITITDVNDNPPVFNQPFYKVSALENTKVGEVILKISATDIDFGRNGVVYYSFPPNESRLPFEIDKETGILTLIEDLDHEEISEYEFEVIASDGGIPTNRQKTKVGVKVNDVNDNAPTFSHSNYTAIVQENRQIGYSVIELLVVDADSEINGAPFTWELLNYGSFHPSFTIEKDGVICISTNKLNHLVQNRYLLEVQVCDSGSPPLCATTKVMIVVVEESQFPPTVFPLYISLVSFNKPFPGGIIGKVSAHDQDPYDILQYSMHHQNKEADIANYFDIDSDNGSFKALYPLDTGMYETYIFVSDGRFETSVKALVDVSVITEDMLDSSVIVTLGNISPSRFLVKYKKKFIRSITFELAVKEESLKILSIQSSHKSKNVSRIKRDNKKSLDILFVIKRNSKSYFTREQLIDQLLLKQKQIKKRINLSTFSIMNSNCHDQMDCNNNGHCIDIIEFIEGPHLQFATKSGSLVGQEFTQRAICQCRQGLGGTNCENILNACGHRPCAEYEQCIPNENSQRGYSCRCSEGMTGPHCDINLSDCRLPKCHYPQQPMSFRGKSYAQYSVPAHAQSTTFSLSVYIRTRHPVGTVLYSTGEVDYSILEVIGGYIQYRWDCGSGEGLVRVSAVAVDDDKWHSIRLKRSGTVSKLTVDTETSSGAAPGMHDSLNLNSNYMFLGAKVNRGISSGSSKHISTSFGFVGCMDQVIIDGHELPVAPSPGNSAANAIMKRLANVELECPHKLPIPGVCGSYPCLNGGTCTEESSPQPYKCTCPARFTGPQCQVDTAPCSSSPCLNGGICITVGHSYKCQCPSKLSGKRCEYGVHCNPNPCQNGGRCEEGISGPICKCQQFTGATCDEDIDECARHNPCHNGGSCLNFYGGFKCFCGSNVTGEYCMEEQRIPINKSSVKIAVEDLLYILAIFTSCLLTLLFFITWQRKRWKNKQDQQNNFMKHELHVKNDLKSDDSPKRNSKICNVEADQVPVIPPRPVSYTPSTDSALLLTLKHLADMSCQPPDKIELTTINRKLDDYDSGQKPWDHHNNLSEAYCSPIKDVGSSVPVNPEKENFCMSTKETDDQSNCYEFCKIKQLPDDTTDKMSKHEEEICPLINRPNNKSGITSPAAENSGAFDFQDLSFQTIDNSIKENTNKMENKHENYLDEKKSLNNKDIKTVSEQSAKSNIPFNHKEEPPSYKAVKISNVPIIESKENGDLLNQHNMHPLQLEDYSQVSGDSTTLLNQTSFDEGSYYIDSDIFNQVTANLIKTTHSEVFL